MPYLAQPNCQKIMKNLRKSNLKLSFKIETDLMRGEEPYSSVLEGIQRFSFFSKSLNNFWLFFFSLDDENKRKNFRSLLIVPIKEIVFVLCFMKILSFYQVFIFCNSRCSPSAFLLFCTEK